VNGHADRPADFVTVGVHDPKSGGVAHAEFDGVEAVAVRPRDVLPDKAAEVVVGHQSMLDAFDAKRLSLDSICERTDRMEATLEVPSGALAGVSGLAGSGC